MPRVGVRNPSSAFSTVVLPPPDGPVSATNSPGRTSNDTPATAGSDAPGYVCPRSRTRATSPDAAGPGRAASAGASAGAPAAASVPEPSRTPASISANADSAAAMPSAASW